MIARAGAEAYELLMPRELAEAVRLRLERYRLRARCALAVIDVAVTTNPSPTAIGYLGPGLDWWLLPVAVPG